MSSTDTHDMAMETLVRMMRRLERDSTYAKRFAEGMLNNGVPRERLAEIEKMTKEVCEQWGPLMDENPFIASKLTGLKDPPFYSKPQPQR